MRSKEDLIAQLRDCTQTQIDDFFEHHSRELLGSNEEPRSIQVSLKVEIAKKVHLEQQIEREKHKLKEIHNIPDYTDVQREEIRKHIAKLNDNLSVR